jgi:hypothetical protein
MAIKFREHRGGLSDSMATVIEIENRAGLVAHIAKVLEPFHFDKERVDKGLRVEPYAHDARIGWNTHIVTLKGYGVLGFTDGPL